MYSVKSSKSMRHVICVLLITLLTLIAAAPVQAKSSVGIGIQFGGTIGWQGSTRWSNNNVRVAVGAVGLSAGYDYFFNDKVSIGVQGFIIGLSWGRGISVNYYFTRPEVSGWMLGIDAFSASSGFAGNTGESSNRVLLSVGYRFGNVNHEQ